MYMIAAGTDVHAAEVKNLSGLAVFANTRSALHAIALGNYAVINQGSGSVFTVRLSFSHAKTQPGAIPPLCA